MALKIKKGLEQESEEGFEEEKRLKSKLLIDRNALDDELVQQPFLYMEASEAHVMAASQRDEAKENLARVDARIAEELRARAAKSGDRTSETRIGDLVVMHPDHIKAQERYAQCKRRADTLAAVQASFEQRGRMLRELSNLFAAGYFAKTAIKEASAQLKQSNATLAKQLYRKRRELEIDE